jgi:hypothetical protein
LFSLTNILIPLRDYGGVRRNLSSFPSHCGTIPLACRFIRQVHKAENSKNIKYEISNLKSVGVIAM